MPNVTVPMAGKLAEPVSGVSALMPYCGAGACAEAQTATTSVANSAGVLLNTPFPRHGCTYVALQASEHGVPEQGEGHLSVTSNLILPLQFRTRPIRNLAPLVQGEPGEAAQRVAA